MKGGEPGFTNWSRLEVGQAFHVVVVVHGDHDKLSPSGCFVVLETKKVFIYKQVSKASAKIKTTFFLFLPSCNHFLGGSSSRALH